ncbi:hypothetical protein CENSYa_1560 [Cenarchaeum symbiosum A]|uniref:DUF3800 domain-containing protein n=1 Tax=Cenarchaeum symbiosum (strain A) TaxID=414004 RepID=A0RXW3_CENSY|nr:hypothetical protein CENSYa_1560 [Cenarchaeum symbiosum A]
MDGSGDTGIPIPAGGSKHEWYVMAGLIIDPATNIKAKNRVCDILQRYIPEKVREDNKDSHYELHYTDIRFGSNIYSPLSLSDRNSMIDEVFELLLELKPILMAAAIHKTRMHQLSDGNKNFNTMTVRSLIDKFSAYTVHFDKIGSIVYDEEQYKKDAMMRKKMRLWRRHGLNPRNAGTQADMLPNIINTISLSPSEMSSGLQLTDFCARAVWDYLQKKDDSRYKQIRHLFEIGGCTSMGRRLEIIPDVS